MTHPKLTLCLPYYMNAGMLERQLEDLSALPGNLRAGLAVIVVDDGSPNGEALGRPIGCPLTIFRVDTDVRWNQDAAHNIAVHHAVTDWVLLTDIDHLVPCETFAMILETKLDKNRVYRFSRETLEPTGETTPYKPHPNSWLMRRSMYQAIGGYDERFAGYYGTDADFRDRILEHAPVVQVPEVLIRVPRSVIPDASTTTYLRKQPEDFTELRRLKEDRDALGSWRPLNLCFPYHQIYP